VGSCVSLAAKVEFAVVFVVSGLEGTRQGVALRLVVVLLDAVAFVVGPVVLAFVVGPVAEVVVAVVGVEVVAFGVPLVVAVVSHVQGPAVRVRREVGVVWLVSVVFVGDAVTVVVTVSVVVEPLWAWDCGAFGLDVADDVVPAPDPPGAVVVAFGSGDAPGSGAASLGSPTASITEELGPPTTTWTLRARAWSPVKAHTFTRRPTLSPALNVSDLLGIVRSKGTREPAPQTIEAA